MVTTGIPASTAACTAGAIATASSGLMMMPSTPWVTAASTSAVCLVVWFWPSVSISVMPPISVALSRSAFCMCTKNGNSSAGSDQASVSSLSCACAGPKPPASDDGQARNQTRRVEVSHRVPP